MQQQLAGISGEQKIRNDGIRQALIILTTLPDKEDFEWLGQVEGMTVDLIPHIALHARF